MTILTLKQAQSLTLPQYGGINQLADALGLTRGNAAALRGRGVFQPRHTVIEGVGGKTTHIFDMGDCRYAHSIFTSAHTREAKAKAREQIEIFWANKAIEYANEDK